MALQLNITNATNITDTTSDVVVDDFRFNVAELGIAQGGRITFALAASVVAASPMNIMPRVTLASGERIAFQLKATYDATDNTTAKRLIGIGVDSNDIEGDWSIMPCAAQTTATLTIWRDAAATAAATVEFIWIKLP